MLQTRLSPTETDNDAHFQSRCTVTYDNRVQFITDAITGVLKFIDNLI